MDIVTELNVKCSDALLKVAYDMEVMEVIKLLYNVHENENCPPILSVNEMEPEACDAICNVNNASYTAETVEEDFRSEDSSIKDIPTDQYAMALERSWYNASQVPCLENRDLELVRPEMSINVPRDSYIMALEHYRHNEDPTVENRELQLAGRPAMSVNVPRDSYLIALERYRHNEDPSIENKVPINSNAVAIEHYRREQPLDDSSIEEQSVGDFSSLDSSIEEDPALRCELPNLNMEYNLDQDLRDTILKNSFYKHRAESENEDYDGDDYIEMELVRGPAKELVTNDNLDSIVGGKLCNLRLIEPLESEDSFESEEFLELEDSRGSDEESLKSEVSFEFGGSFGSEVSFKSEVYLEIEQNTPRKREREQYNCLFD